jgi:hypothetical protein
MERKTKIWIIIITLIALLVGCIIGVVIKQNKIHTPAKYQPIDTSYNKVVLDSIEYRIIEKDSTIKKIKYQMKYEVNKVYTLDDSATVKLFYRLCTSE